MDIQIPSSFTVVVPQPQIDTLHEMSSMPEEHSTQQCCLIPENRDFPFSSLVKDFRFQESIFLEVRFGNSAHSFEVPTRLEPSFSSSLVFFLLIAIVFRFVPDAINKMDRRRQHRSKKVKSPPLRAQFILYLLLAKRESEAIIGDLVEMYPQMVKKFGKRKADLLVWSQVIRAVVPIILSFVRPVVRYCLRAGGLLAAAAFIRRILS